MGLLKPIRIDENRRRLPLAGTNQKIWGVTVNGVGARERDRVLTASASSGPSECPCLIRTESCRCSDRQGRFVSEAISAQWLWTFLNRSPMLPAKYKRSKMKVQNMKRMRRPDCRSLAPDISRSNASAMEYRPSPAHSFKKCLICRDLPLKAVGNRRWQAV